MRRLIATSVPPRVFQVIPAIANIKYAMYSEFRDLYSVL